MRDYFHVVLRQLSEHGIQEVIYIDGLDQLEAEASGNRDLSFLPNSPPPGIVIVLGTHPDDTLQPLDGKKVQVEYRLPHLSLANFQQSLTQRGVVTPAAHRLYTALQGNAFYLSLVIQELKAGPIADLNVFIQQISANPENLFGLTFKRLRQDRTFWRAILHPILTLLLVAQEPLGIGVLRQLLDAEDDDVRTALQRLGGLVAQDSQNRSFLYHLKVRDYVAEDLDDPDSPFVVSQAQMLSMHTTLADWCVQNDKDIARIWEDTTGLEQIRRVYARQHTITHLAAGQSYDRMWSILEDGCYGRHKRRFDPSTQLYAQDMDRARDVAVVTDDLHRLWRWSLLRVSLTSQMDAWPDALFLGLVHLGRGSEALSRAELLSDSRRKSALLTQLAPHFDGATAQQVWHRAQAIAAAITDDELRAHALRDLAAAQTQAGRWTDAQTTTAAITDDWVRADALRALAEAMATVQHPEAAATFTLAATAAAAITHDWASADALSAVAAAMATAQHPDVAATFALAATTAAAIPHAWPRARALIDLAQAQAQAHHPEAATTFALAATVAASIPDDWQRASALSALAKALAMAGWWTDARATIAAITHDGERTSALCTLAKAQANAQRWTDVQATS